MKIALYEASNPEKLTDFFYPLSLGYLASYVKKNLAGVEVKIFRSLDRLLDYSPHMAGISCMSSTFPDARLALKKIGAELGCPVFLGGTHISSIPETLPEEADAGVIGEGEATFLDLVKLCGKKRITPEDLRRIDGLVMRGSDRIIRTKKRELIGDIDSIPYPVRDSQAGGFCDWSFSSRGCPYNCCFCYSSLFWNTYRAHSPEYVAGELLEIKKDDPDPYYSFMDDLFSASLDRVERIGTLIREKSGRDFIFTVTARAAMVDNSMAEVFSRVGANYVHLGLESGSDSVLRFLKQEDCSVAQNQRALDILHSYGINGIGTFILGAPGETREDMEKTFCFIKENLSSGKLHSFSFGPLIAFPGTKIWDYGVSKGLISPENFDWASLDININNFKRSSYRLLNDRISMDTFCYYMEKLKSLMNF